MGSGGAAAAGDGRAGGRELSACHASATCTTPAASYLIVPGSQPSQEPHERSCKVARAGEASSGLFHVRIIATRWPGRTNKDV